MTSDQHILIVEDEVGLAEILRDYLEASGYLVTMIHNGLEVTGWVKQHNPAVILLDLMLPGKDGMEICKEIRTFSNTPIIMTTARVEEIDRLLGLELGADDYVCKPYSPREVVARVKATLRRIAAFSGNTPKTADPISLDEERFLAFIGGEQLELTPVEFRMMQTFLDNQGRVFSRSQLMDKAYTDQRVVSDRTVDTHIKNLRKKIQPHLPEGEVIHSVYGVGYKFEFSA
ncbi:response regulator [Neptuniibacter caesariensis]|uniref:DNA-binding response regulator BaeS n=1 Tax=Neptuniibacter caesariensis TaxID=207954 RepID=A0A7U8C4W4_NEPCE|nr:response regulator [Neptuniibacter caesariensis]EAR61577.1 DNA-binding response regulator BaeS [Oceanospirillum sp. MED92] [Neptuniibacter caesariensis]